MRHHRMQNFREACHAHQQVADSCAVLGQHGKAIWSALTGTGSVAGSLADAVALTMPEGVVGLLRRRSGVPASYAFSAVAECITKGIDWDDDLQVRAAMVGAWSKFEERRKLANAVQEGFGWDRSASWETVRYIGDDEYRAEMIKRIAELAGRMYEAMRGMKVRRPNAQPEEVKQTTIGGDFELLLPSEHAFMAQGGAMGDLKAIQILNKQALQLQMAGDEECNRGPLVLTVDESGSMHDYDYHYDHREGSHIGRNTWAKACCAALTRIAHEDKRMVRFVHYGTSTAVSECKPGDHEAVIEALTHFLGGGTAIKPALELAIAQVGDLEKAGWRGADIVLISDGGDWDSYNPTIDKMDAKEIKLWTVAIDDEFCEECSCGEDHLETNGCTCNAPLRTRAAKYVYVHGESLVADAAKGLEDAAFSQPRRK